MDLRQIKSKPDFSEIDLQSGHIILYCAILIELIKSIMLQFDKKIIFQ